MTRDYAIDARLFNAREDIEQISKLYPSHQDEVKNFLRSHSGAGYLQGVSNEKVYELISEKLGYPFPV